MGERSQQPVPREAVRIPPLGLVGQLRLPPGCESVVALAHGSGRGRSSSGEARVLEVLLSLGIGGLELDLLTDREARERGWSFDTSLLAERLRHSSGWLRSAPATLSLALGYFGEGPGAAAALLAAADPEAEIGAIVCQAGRTDLALAALPVLRAPTLLIVGALDAVTLGLNRKALTELRCENELVVIPGAGNRFDEPGALEEVATLAGRWFAEHLGARKAH